MDKEIVLKALKDGVDNVGPKEPNGDNKGPAIATYLATVGLPEGYAWCAAFIKYRLLKAAEDLGLNLSPEFKQISGWVPDWYNYAKKHNIWIPLEDVLKDNSLIKPGYLVLFWGSRRRRHYHIGMVKKRVNSTFIEILEGNTDPGGLNKVNPDGDGVYVRRRKYKVLGANAGFIKLY